jgi:hypothetical protein
VQAARQPAHEQDEQRRAEELVEPVGGVVRQHGEEGREQVGVEGAVVGLVPEGRGELAPQHVAAHEEEDRVVVRDREPEARAVQLPPGRPEGRAEGEARPGHGARRAHGVQVYP